MQHHNQVIMKRRMFHLQKANLLATAHKVYVAASSDENWLAVIISWGIIYQLEGEGTDEKD